MDTSAIYTIGYGSRTIEAFVALLQRYEIGYLLDVRSRPYSRYKPEFSKDALQRALEQHGIRYLFMGDTLGGIPDDPKLYDGDGKVDYHRLSQGSHYKAGIQRLRTAWEKGLLVALMCSEGKPQECHRSKLIGRTLKDGGVLVSHIDEGGEIKTQDTIELLLSPQPTLFEIPLTSRKRYRGPAEEGE